MFNNISLADIKEGWQGLPSPSPSWTDKRTLQDHDSMLVRSCVNWKSKKKKPGACFITVISNRKPESSRRPTFPQLVEMLSRADFELFAWEEEDLKDSDPQVKLIGAPLEVAQDLYPELQRSYIIY